MPAFQDLSGMKFKHILVSHHAGFLDGYHRWVCRCDCGNWIVRRSGELKERESCGCEMRKKLKVINTIHGETSGRSGASSLYACYSNIKGRCLRKSSKSFPDYGGRGIKLHREWIHGSFSKSGFQLFKEYIDKELGTRPKGHSLDRKDNNGNYEPGNLRWADSATQARNHRGNIKVIFNGEELILADAKKKAKISTPKLYYWMKRGLTHQEIFNRYSGGISVNARLITMGDETKTLVEWEAKTGISRYTISMRLDKLNWSVERALTAPVQQHKSHRRKVTVS